MDIAAVRYLAEIPSPTQGAWFLGPIPVRAYAVCILAGIVAATVITDLRMRRRGAPPWLILDIAVWAIPSGIIGARIYHVITSPDAYFGSGPEANPWLIFKIWNGGLGIWGAVAGGALGVWIACRRAGIPFAFVADTLAVGLPVAQAMGRWGNWFNNELYGGHTDLPWGLKVYLYDLGAGRAVVDSAGQPQQVAGGPFHPTFLYESIWDLGVALLVWLVDRRFRLGRGRAFALYVMAYTAGRFWVEALRVDPAHHLLGMRVNNWVSILVFLGALVYFVAVRGPQTWLTVDEQGQLIAHPAPGSSGPGSSGSSGPGSSGPDGGDAGAGEPDETESGDPDDDGTGPAPPPGAEREDPATPATPVTRVDAEASAAARRESR